MTDETRKPPRPAPPGRQDSRSAIDKLGGNKPLTIAVERPRAAGFDPYARVGTGAQPNQDTGATSRRDLRKLSEWIKMKRDLEERRARGEFDENNDD